MTFTVDKFIGRTRRKLLKLKDESQDEWKKNENKDKVMMQETLKSLPRMKLIQLDSRRVFLSWQARYQQLKGTLKNMGVPDWQSQLLDGVG